MPKRTAAMLEEQLAKQGLLRDFAPAVREHVIRAAVSAADDLSRWAAPYTAIRQERIMPLVVSVAAAAPFATAADVAATARLSLWVFTVDDLFDEGGLRIDELEHRAQRYAQVARDGVPASIDNPLEQALYDVREDLARYPLFADLGSTWADALEGTLQGMLREEQWRLAYRADHTKLPAYDDYLECGLFSIGAPPHMWAAVMTAGDLTAPHHLDHLGRMVRGASIAIRLANDLRSYQKELAEGNVNSLLILEHTGRGQGRDEPSAHGWALERVRRTIADCLDELRTLEGAARTQSGRPEKAIQGIARFVCGFYQRFDYHTFTDAGRESSA